MTVEQTEKPSRSRSPFWDSAQGKSARSFLEAWGAVAKERLLTGDSTATPAPDGPMMGGGRSGSCLPDISLKFTVVNDFLKTNATDRQRRLCWFTFVDGLDWTVRLKYTFADGTTSGWVSADAPPPLVPVQSVESDYQKHYTYNLGAFDAPEVDEVCKLWRRSRVEFLEAELVRFARQLSRKAGL